MTHIGGPHSSFFHDPEEPKSIKPKKSRFTDVAEKGLKRLRDNSSSEDIDLVYSYNQV